MTISKSDGCEEPPSPVLSLRDILWWAVAIAGMLISIACTLEISRRLLMGTLDVVAFLGTLIVLVLTSSPLLKGGQNVARWLLDLRSPNAMQHGRIQLVAVASVIVATFLCGFLWLGMPILGRLYNNLGAADLRQGNLAVAKANFERSVSLDAGQVVAYQNLADTYYAIGQPEQATTWYLRAIERDLNFAGPYLGLSEVYNQTKQTDAAIAAALGGMYVLQRGTEPPRYSEDYKRLMYGLLANLGRAYVAAGHTPLAQEQLQMAVDLEPDLGSATPHFFLAQIYDQQQQFDLAQVEYEGALRYLTKEASHTPDTMLWRMIARTRLAELASGANQ